MLWTTDDAPRSVIGINTVPDASAFFMVSQVEGDVTAEGVQVRRIQARDAATGRPLWDHRRGFYDVSTPGQVYPMAEAGGRTHVISRIVGDGGKLVELCRSSEGLPREAKGGASGQSLGAVFQDPGAGQHVQFFNLEAGRPAGPRLARSGLAALFPAGDWALVQGFGGDAGRALRIREVASGRALGPAFWEDGAGNSHQVTPDGRHLLYRSNRGTTILWRLAEDPIPLALGRNAIGAPDGPAPVGERGRQVRLLPKFNRAGDAALCSVETPGGPVARVTDPADGRPIGLPAQHRYQDIRAACFSPDGRRFATGSSPIGLAGEARVWDAATGQPVTPPLPHTNYVWALAFSPDGRTLAAGDYHGIVHLWDVATGRPAGPPLVGDSIVWALAFSPDGRTLAVGRHFDHSGKPGVQLWDVASGRKAGDLLPSPTSIKEVSFGPDGRVVVADDGSGIQLWDTSGPRPTRIGELLNGETTAPFRPDGRVLVTVGQDGSIRQRDAATGALTATLFSGPSPGRCLAYDPAGRLLAAGFDDGTVRLIDPATAKPVGPPRSLDRPVCDVAFRADGGHFSAIDEGGGSRTWAVPAEAGDRDIAEVALRIEARTGHRLAPGPSVVKLGAEEWADRLARSGGTPSPADLADDPAWHDAAARAAARGGLTLAALWHLDRLVAARPGDWTLHARRAKLHASAGRHAEAAAESETAGRLAPPGSVEDWQVQCAVGAMNAGAMAEALWYLDRLIAARPGDWAPLADRSAVHARLGHAPEAAADRARLLALGGGEPEMALPEAERLAGAGRWAEAAALLGRCSGRNPLDPELAQARMVAALFAGDRAGCLESRRAIFAQIPQTEPFAGYLLDQARWLILADRVDPDPELVRVLESIGSSLGPDRGAVRSLISTLLGAMQLRSGRDLDRAIGLLAEAAGPADADPEGLSLLALAWARKGDAARAQSYLDRVPGPPAQGGPSFWEARRAEWLRREAERARLDASFPADPFAR